MGRMRPQSAGRERGRAAWKPCTTPIPRPPTWFSVKCRHRLHFQREIPTQGVACISGLPSSCCRWARWASPRMRLNPAISAPAGRGRVYKDRSRPTGSTTTRASGIATTCAAAPEFVVVDADKGTRRAGLRPQETGRGTLEGGRDRVQTRTACPSTPSSSSTRTGPSVSGVGDTTWKCDLAGYECSTVRTSTKADRHPAGRPASRAGRRRRRFPCSDDSDQPVAVQPPAPTRRSGPRQPARRTGSGPPLSRNNVWVRDDGGKETQLTRDGTAAALRHARLVARLEGPDRLPHRARRPQGSLPDRVVAAGRRPGQAADAPYALPGDKIHHL